MIGASDPVRALPEHHVDRLPPYHFGCSPRFRSPRLHRSRQRAKRHCRGCRQAGVAARYRDRLAKAPMTITEYASMSCPHCAAFGENVFPMLRTKYHRHRQGAFRVPRVSARYQGGGGLDAGALHRQGRLRKISRRRRRPCSSSRSSWWRRPRRRCIFVGKMKGMSRAGGLGLRQGSGASSTGSPPTSNMR